MNFEELRNLDLSEISSWPWVAKGFVWVIMVVFIWLVGYRLFVSPSLDELDAYRRQEPQLKQEFEQKYAVAARLEAGKEQSEANDTGAGPSELPLDSEVASLLDEITRIGRDNGLALQYFKPEKERSKGYYAEVPIRVGLSGTYHQFGRFISTLAQLKILVTVDNVHISRDKGGGLKLEMVARTYHAIKAAAGNPAAQGKAQ